MIESYFEKYPGSVFSMNYTKNVKTIHFWMNNKWTIKADRLPNDIVIHQEKSTLNDEDKSKHYSIIYFDESANRKESDATFEKLFDALSVVFDFNIEKEKKEELLKAKISELQSKFTELSLDELKEMDFK